MTDGDDGREDVCACCGEGSPDDDSVEERDCGCPLCEACWDGRRDECPPERHDCPNAGRVKPDAD